MDVDFARSIGIAASHDDSIPHAATVALLATRDEGVAEYSACNLILVHSIHNITRVLIIFAT